tara:strand:- start:265 stop:399 length:135 start_codon:yes stop_codon:yes gene_type:complete
MKEFVKVIFALVLVAVVFGAAIGGIDNPKPSNLAVKITRSLKGD